MNRTEVENIKKAFPVGTKVVCDFMYDSHAIPSGTVGTVRKVDDMATIHVNWENGRTLGLIFGEDKFHKL